MDREHIEDSAGKVKGTFEDTAGKVTDDKKLLDEVGSRTTSRQLVFGVTSWRSFLLPGYWRFVTSGKAALPARNEQRGELSGKNRLLCLRAHDGQRRRAFRLDSNGTCF